MTGERWIRVTVAENIPPREGRAVQVGDREIALFNLGDRFLAVDNRCPHRGGPLADGIVAGSAAVCPLHAWRVNLETGVVERPTSEHTCVRKYATKLEGNLVLLKVPCALPEPATS